MGTIQHDVVIATTWCQETQEKIEDYVFNNLLVDKVVRHSARMGKYKTYILGPDGSKEGWDDSDRGDIWRFNFILFLESFTYEDGSSPVRWVEVSYGELGQKLVQGNNQDRSIEDEQASLISESARKIYGDNYKGHQLKALQYCVHVGSFPWALNLIKNGEKLTRRGWNGKGQYVFLVQASCMGIPDNEELAPCLAMKTCSGLVQLGWLASQADMLADDWELELELEL